MLGAHALSTATVLWTATEGDGPSARGSAHVFALLDVAFEFRVSGLGRLVRNRHNRLRSHHLRLLLLHHLLLLDHLLLLLHHLLLLDKLLLHLRQLLLCHLLLHWLLLHLLHLHLLASKWLSNLWYLTDGRERDWSPLHHWRLCLVSHSYFN